jgi:hypothetical protein
MSGQFVKELTHAEAQWSQRKKKGWLKRAVSGFDYLHFLLRDLCASA